VQLLGMGHPILGDRKYASKTSGDLDSASSDWRDEKSIALVASAIFFKSTTGDKQIDLSIELPQSWQTYIK